MHKFLCTLVLFLSLNAWAALPIQKNNWELGGAASFTQTKYKSDSTYGDDTVTTSYLAPMAQYFFLDHLSFGGTLSHISTKSSTGTITNNSWGPILTYYFCETQSVAYLVSYSTSFYETSYRKKVSDSTYSVGTRLFFTQNAAFGIGLSYRPGIEEVANTTYLTGAFAIYY